MKVLGKSLLAGLVGLSLTGSVFAQEEASSSGEIRRIDEAKGKIAIKHGAIADFKLPAMTLVYEIDKSLLSTVKPGDQVKFKAIHENNHYIIKEIKVK
ncbi:copper-binding protein [Pelistega sp. MC2]|uniref:copper-binding protein n=1 Tax=Pelistega sp. MC2 TaxID=1720297 RepID=UPI0008DB300C|nr:copper-binding protein [Pelistega sp. MC2]